MSKPFAKPAEPSPGEKKAPVAAPAPKPPKPARKPSAWPWGIVRRITLSVLICLHLAAVFVAPWFLDIRGREGFALPVRDAEGHTVAPHLVRPEQRTFEPPVLAEWVYRALMHYGNLLYINNGYEFFSPDPIWSHLIDYEVFDAAGQTVAKGRIPDRRDQSPRLFYHRHMMLAEQSGDPAMQGSELTIAKRLLASNGGQRVRLKYVRHHLLRPQDVLQGKRPDEPATYEILGELERTSDDFAREAAQSGQGPRGGEGS